MRLTGKKLLYDFKQKHADARSQVESLEVEIEAADWDTPHDVKNRYPKTSIIGNQQAIFDICGNKYRLWVLISYKIKVVTVIKIGTHKEYDKWKIV